jgi:dihydroorotase
MTYLVHAGHIDMMRLAELMSATPREILGLETIHIKEGAKANLTIIAPREEWTFEANRSLSKSKNTPFQGFALKGKPKFAVNRGIMRTCEV